MKKTIFRTMLLAFGASRGEEAARLEEIIKVSMKRPDTM